MRRFEQDVRLLPSNEDGLNRVDPRMPVHAQVTGQVVVVALRRDDL